MGSKLRRPGIKSELEEDKKKKAAKALEFDVSNNATTKGKSHKRTSSIPDLDPIPVDGYFSHDETPTPKHNNSPNSSQAGDL